MTFGKLLRLFSGKINLLHLLYSTPQRQGYVHPIKQICVKVFITQYISITHNSFNLDDSDIYLPVFPTGNNRKHVILITPKLAKKAIINFDLSKVPGLDCILVVIQKNCEPELSYVLA